MQYNGENLMARKEYMHPKSCPILEFDPARDAILNPRKYKSVGELPHRAVLCFFHEVLKDLAENEVIVPQANLASEMGPNPIYTLDWQGQQLTVMHPGVGAPLAAGFLEELIAQGVDTFIAVGGAGVLEKTTDAGHPFILTSAVRDEGTSYHYLPEGREVQPAPQAVASLQAALEMRGMPYELVKAWTTDGLYRETAAKRDLRVAEGCRVVEMEAAAFFAVSQFRGVAFGQIVYGGDLVVPEGWDKRNWVERLDDRHRMFWLAVEACARL
jgi:uridine phosphorylase